MHTRAIAAALLAALVTAAPQAMARVDVPAKAVMTIASGRSTEFQDGIKWSNDTLTNAEKEAAVLKQIEDAHTMGVRVFFYLAPNNGTAHVGRLARWNASARAFNAAHTGDKVCLSVMFTSDAVGDGSTTGVIPMFDTADAGGADSPLCQIASKPLVATRGNAVCINPLTGLSARGPQFAILTNTYNTATDHSDAACVTSLVNAGATVVKSFPWAIQKVAYSTSATIDTKKTAIEGTGTGVEFVMGVGSSWARACGIGGNGALTSNIEITDLNYWQHFLDGRQLAISKAVNYMLLNDAAPGALDEGSTITTSLICDSRDPVNHNVDSSGVNPGFTCPSVPSYLTAAIPAGYQNSLSVPFWTTRGLHRAQQIWSAWLRNSAEPDASLPFVGFMYRQHAWGLTGTWDICNAGSYSAQAGGVGTTPQHMIALTSWAPDPIRVQVVLAGETIFDGTLPAKQMKQIGSTQQTLVSIGSRVGRPTIRVLNSNGTVIASREGLLEITNTPKHYNGQTGRNPHNYADYVDFAASGGAWSGIKIGSTGNVTNNVVNGVAGSGIVASQNADNVTISGNTVVSTKTAISVGSAQGSGLGDSMAVANNIIATATTGIMTAGDIGTDAVYPTNLIYQATTPMSTEVAAAATGTVTADPKFVSASDFHLQTSSPARDVGTLAYSTGADRVGRARGTTPDIGAYEFYDAAARSPCVSQDDAVLHDCAPGGTAYPCQAAKITCPTVPTLTSPQTISVGSAGAVITLDQNDDALITCSAVVTTRISVIGGDDVHIRGCEISQAWPSTEERGLSFVGTRRAYVEGVIVDMQDRCDALTIQPNRSDIGWTNTNTDLTVVNSWLGNNNVNTVGTCSGDCIEAQGSATRGGMAGSIDYTLRNVTCAAKGLGITIPDRYSSARSTANLDNVNMRFGVNGSPRSDIYRYADGGAPLLYLFGSSDADLQKWPVALGANVFLDWKSSNRNISPGPATGTPAETDFSVDNIISFASTSQITGQVRRGPPSTYDFAPRSKLGANYDRTWFCNADQVSYPPLELQKTWVATSSSSDYSYYSPSGSPFVTSQNPWGNWDMAVGDVFNAEAYLASDGYLRMRTITGPLQVSNNLPKGAVATTFGDHFDQRASIRPLGDGVWSNQLGELKVSAKGTATAGSTGAYARAIQIHGFRTAFTGSGWQEYSSTDGDTYDIQIRYKTSGSFPPYGGGSDVFMERKTIGPHTWDIYRTNGGWTSDLGMGFVLTENTDNIENVDVEAILAYALTDANIRYSRNDSGIYVRGVQTWMEPISGTMDITTEGMKVRYNGQDYGAWRP